MLASVLNTDERMGIPMGAAATLGRKAGEVLGEGADSEGMGLP